MTVPHAADPQPSNRTVKRVLGAVGVLALVAMFATGVVSFLPGGLGGVFDRADPPQVDGQVLWTSEDIAVQLGPGGWLTHPGEGSGDVVRNVRTGETWTVDDMTSTREVTEDGVVVQPDAEALHIKREGSSDSTSTTEIADAFGDEDLWPGTNLHLAGVSETHVVAATCLAPKPSNLYDDPEGGRYVLAGVALEDASVTWTLDTRGACSAEFGVHGYPSTLPAQEYLVLEPAEEQIMAVDIDTGKVAQRWSGAKRYWFAVQGEHVLASDGQGSVTWSSLRTGKELADVSCDGAGIGDPGDISRQIAPGATPFVECGDTVHVLDDDEFVDVGAPPAPTDTPLPQGEEVAVGRLVLERVADTETVHLRDALTGRTLDDLTVPEDFQVAGFLPAGDLVGFVKWERGGDRSTGNYRIFDARTGDVVVTADGPLRTGPDASPDGVVVVETDDLDTEGTRLWAAGTKGEKT